MFNWLKKKNNINLSSFITRPGCIGRLIRFKQEVIELRLKHNDVDVLVTVKSKTQEPFINDYNVKISLNGGITFTHYEFKEFLVSLDEAVGKAIDELYQEGKFEDIRKI